MTIEIVNHTEADVQIENFDKDRYLSADFMASEWDEIWRKNWLLAGLAVDEDAEEGQPDHVFGVDVYSLFDELPEEAELDRQAEALADNF